MAKKTTTSTETMKKLLAEQHQINNGYDSALQTAQAEYNQLERKFHNAEEVAKETHKKYVLGQATNTEYQTAKKQLQDADEVLRDAGFKLDEINTYRKEDLMELLYKLESNLSAYGKEKQQSEQAMKAKALQAKYNYLKALQELSEGYREVWDVQGAVNDLKVELGLIPYNHQDYNSVFNGIVGNIYTNTAGIDISAQEVRDVFMYGTFSKKLLDEIEAGKKAGFIE